MERFFIFIISLTFLAFSLNAQNYRPFQVEVWPESDSTLKFYTVKGYRHGVSYFPKVRHPHVEYEAGAQLTFDKYHSACVINKWMERFAERYPDLTDLYEVAKSYEGRPIIQMTITNKKTGGHGEKPGAFFEGNRHSGEIASAESVLWLMQYLLENYGSDPEISHLVDTKSFYLRPINNPDGHNLYMNTAQSNRSTVRPHDSDDDGLIDEDGPEDLDGDGKILTMRWKDPEKGNYIIDPKDPDGRIMKAAVRPEKGVYLISSEGIDNDGDGKINEDGIGGLDLHRNYPENWRPEKKYDATGRGFTQSGAGEYPLSEMETRSVVSFLLEHPNIYIVNSMDTRVPMHLRPPSTSASEERMYPEDLGWYKYFDELGKSITGYARAGDVYMDYNKGNPLFGHGPDFGYWYYGAIWYGDEIWNGARYKDYNGDSIINEIDMLIWDEEENDEMGFSDWKPFMHPTLGEVEIGGFDLKFFLQNPPSKHMLQWVKNQALFNLEMVKHLPELAWGKIEVKKIKSYRTDSTDFELTIEIKNKGKLPTALKQAHLVKIVREDNILIEFSNITDSINVFSVLPEPGNKQNKKKQSPISFNQKRLTKNLGYIDGEKSIYAKFYLRVYGDNSLKAKASFLSTRGGVLRDREFIIN